MNVNTFLSKITVPQPSIFLMSPGGTVGRNKLYFFIGAFIFAFLSLFFFKQSLPPFLSLFTTFLSTFFGFLAPINSGHSFEVISHNNLPI